MGKCLRQLLCGNSLFVDYHLICPPTMCQFSELFKVEDVFSRLAPCFLLQTGFRLGIDGELVEKKNYFNAEVYELPGVVSFLIRSGF